MLRSASDPETALAVHLLRNDGRNAASVEEDMRALMSALRAQDLACVGHPAGPVFVLVIDGEVPIPNASARKGLAEAATALRSRRHCVVLVTRSTLVRGALRAITWIAPPRTGHVVAIADDLEDGFLRAEAARGEPLPFLRALATRVGARVASATR